MVAKKYIPECGDIVWIDFDPSKGREKKGRRPALVMSKKSYNKSSKLMLVCPITSRIKNYPFEIFIKTETIGGVILSDQIKSASWVERKAEFIEKADEKFVEAVMENIFWMTAVE